MFSLFVKSVTSAEPFKKEPGQWHPPWRKITVHPVLLRPSPPGQHGGPRSRSLRPGFRPPTCVPTAPGTRHLEVLILGSHAAADLAATRAGETSGRRHRPRVPSLLAEGRGSTCSSPCDVTSGLPSAVVDKSLDIPVLSAETLRSDRWLLEGLVPTIKCQPARLQPADVRRLGHALSTLVDNSTSGRSVLPQSSAPRFWLKTQ